MSLCVYAFMRLFGIYVTRPTLQLFAIFLPLLLYSLEQKEILGRCKGYFD